MKEPCFKKTQSQREKWPIKTRQTPFPEEADFKRLQVSFWEKPEGLREHGSGKNCEKSLCSPVLNLITPFLMNREPQKAPNGLFKEHPKLSMAPPSHWSHNIHQINLKNSVLIQSPFASAVKPAKVSVKENGVVKGYAAGTSRGLVRLANEDRVCISMSAMKPATRKHELWPTCSFFGVFDGHGGSNCADFLQENLFEFIVSTAHFPLDPRKALKEGFKKAERVMMEKEETSGSTANVILIVGDHCFMGNVGDSRSVMSVRGGEVTKELSMDHKPYRRSELKRIMKAGGRVYQSLSPQRDPRPKEDCARFSPVRVSPGGLSVNSPFLLLLID